MALNDLWRRLTGLDRILVAALLLFCIMLFALVGARAPGESIQVEQDGAVVFTAPLTVDRQVSLEGPLGVTELVIKDGQVRVTSSPCPFKVCVGMGTINRTGQIIACVPNRLLVQIVGTGATKEEADYDLLSR